MKVVGTTLCTEGGGGGFSPMGPYSPDLRQSRQGIGFITARIPLNMNLHVNREGHLFAPYAEMLEVGVCRAILPGML